MAVGDRLEKIGPGSDRRANHGDKQRIVERNGHSRHAIQMVKSSPGFQKQNVIHDSSHCCIICVGSTGTGKSSTVGKSTGVQTRAGSGTERVTMHCEIHRSLTDDQEPVWVDTVGWDDAECEDEETFKDILRFINKSPPLSGT